MDGDDEQLLRGRVYGHGYDDPNPSPRAGQTYVELVGGPLDGLLLDVTGWTQNEIDTGVALPTELGQFPGGRALYDPRPGDPSRFNWSGDTP
ncbi:hypothetical protein [Streptomyces botrytidirepellens]|uniref:Uncharacterized protein n=1 Tax=Streptomyces botrytidirepellens TaxID=2486417 RepID=A0A3M8X0X7_9ACTN|nr:hypothetical protein [Streptomyces botrytidirepellens]RNG36072.1 hypothetical protein EEJ42_03405 [Streptomyces botrytidirepellens]